MATAMTSASTPALAGRHRLQPCPAPRTSAFRSVQLAPSAAGSRFATPKQSVKSAARRGSLCVAAASAKPSPPWGQRPPAKCVGDGHPPGNPPADPRRPCSYRTPLSCVQAGAGGRLRLGGHLLWRLWHPRSVLCGASGAACLLLIWAAGPQRGACCRGGPTQACGQLGLHGRSSGRRAPSVAASGRRPAWSSRPPAPHDSARVCSG